MKIVAACFFGAVYLVFAALAFIAFAGLTVSVLLQSPAGVTVFALAIVFVGITFFAFAHKPTRRWIGKSKNGELPMLLFGSVVGTAFGMVISTIALLLDSPQSAIPIFLLCSVIIPISAMVLERVGLLDAFDYVSLPDLFDD